MITPLEFNIDVKPSNFALQLVQRLGSSGIVALEAAVRGAGYRGISSDAFVGMVVRCLSAACAQPESCSFPWQRKVAVTGTGEKIYSSRGADGERELGGGDFLPVSVSSHSGINVVDAGERFPFFVDKSSQLEDEQQWMARYIEQKRRLDRSCGGGPAPMIIGSSINSFESLDALTYSIRCLYHEIDAGHRNVCTWEDIAAFLGDVTTHGALSMGQDVIPKFVPSVCRSVNGGGKGVTIAKSASCAVSNKTAVALSDQTIGFLDPATFQLKSRLGRHRPEFGTITSLEMFSRNQDRSAAGLTDAGEDDDREDGGKQVRGWSSGVCAVCTNDCVVRLYADDTGDLLYSRPFGTYQTVMKFLKEERTLFCGSKSGVISTIRGKHRTLWRAELFSTQLQPASQITDFASIPGRSNLLACNDLGCIAAFDLETRGIIGSILQVPPALRTMDYSNEYSLVGCGGAGCPHPYLVVLDRSVVPIALQESDRTHKSPISKVMFLPGTPQFLSVDSGGTVKVWDMRKMASVQTIRTCHLIFKPKVNFPVDSVTKHSKALSMLVSVNDVDATRRTSEPLINVRISKPTMRLEVYHIGGVEVFAPGAGGNVGGDGPHTADAAHRKSAVSSTALAGLYVVTLPKELKLRDFALDERNLATKIPAAGGGIRAPANPGQDTSVPLRRRSSLHTAQFDTIGSALAHTIVVSNTKRSLEALLNEPNELVLSHSSSQVFAWHVSTGERVFEVDVTAVVGEWQRNILQRMAAARDKRRLFLTLLSYRNPKKLDDEEREIVERTSTEDGFEKELQRAAVAVAPVGFLPLPTTDFAVTSLSWHFGQPGVGMSGNGGRLEGVASVMMYLWLGLDIGYVVELPTIVTLSPPPPPPAQGSRRPSPIVELMPLLQITVDTVGQPPRVVLDPAAFSTPSLRALLEEGAEKPAQAVQHIARARIVDGEQFSEQAQSNPMRGLRSASISSPSSRPFSQPREASGCGDGGTHESVERQVLRRRQSQSPPQRRATGGGQRAASPDSSPAGRASRRGDVIVRCDTELIEKGLAEEGQGEESGQACLLHKEDGSVVVVCGSVPVLVTAHVAKDPLAARSTPHIVLPLEKTERAHCAELWFSDDAGNRRLYCFLGLEGNTSRFLTLEFHRGPLPRPMTLAPGSAFKAAVATSVVILRTTTICSQPDNAPIQHCFPVATGWHQFFPAVIATDAVGSVNIFSHPPTEHHFPVCVTRFTSFHSSRERFTPAAVAATSSEHGLLFVAAGIHVAVYDLKSSFEKIFPPDWSILHKETAELRVEANAPIDVGATAADRAIHEERLRAQPPTPSLLTEFDVEDAGGDEGKGTIAAVEYLPKKHCLLLLDSESKVHVYSLWGVQLALCDVLGQQKAEAKTERGLVSSVLPIPRRNRSCIVDINASGHLGYGSSGSWLADTVAVDDVPYPFGLKSSGGGGAGPSVFRPSFQESSESASEDDADGHQQQQHDGLSLPSFVDFQSSLVRDNDNDSGGAGGIAQSASAAFGDFPSDSSGKSIMFEGSRRRSLRRRRSSTNLPHDDQTGRIGAKGKKQPSSRHRAELHTVGNVVDRRMSSALVADKAYDAQSALEALLNGDIHSLFETLEGEEKATNEMIALMERAQERAFRIAKTVSDRQELAARHEHRLQKLVQEACAAELEVLLRGNSGPLEPCVRDLLSLTNSHDSTSTSRHSKTKKKPRGPQQELLNMAGTITGYILRTFRQVKSASLHDTIERIVGSEKNFSGENPRIPPTNVTPARSRSRRGDKNPAGATPPPSGGLCLSPDQKHDEADGLPSPLPRFVPVQPEPTNNHPMLEASVGGGTARHSGDGGEHATSSLTSFVFGDCIVEVPGSPTTAEGGSSSAVDGSSANHPPRRQSLVSLARERSASRRVSISTADVRAARERSVSLLHAMGNDDFNKWKEGHHERVRWGSIVADGNGIRRRGTLPSSDAVAVPPPDPLGQTMTGLDQTRARPAEVTSHISSSISNMSRRDGDPSITASGLTAPRPLSAMFNTYLTQRAMLASNLHLSAVEGVHDAVTNKHFTPSIARRLYHQHKSSVHHMSCDRWDAKAEQDALNSALADMSVLASSRLYGTRAASANSLHRRDAPSDMRHNVLFSAMAQQAQGLPSSKQSS